MTRRIDWPPNDFFHAALPERDVIVFVGIEPNVRWGRSPKPCWTRSAGWTWPRWSRWARSWQTCSTRSPRRSPRPRCRAGHRAGHLRIGVRGADRDRGVLQAAAARAGTPSHCSGPPCRTTSRAGPIPRPRWRWFGRWPRWPAGGVETDTLARAATAWEQQVSATVEENDELAAYVERLEAGAEQRPLDVPSGEALAAELEEFLRNQQGAGAVRSTRPDHLRPHPGPVPDGMEPTAVVGHKSGALRAAVFAVQDGVVSNLALIMAAAGAGLPRPAAVLVAGVAGLLAGAFSMAAGEYHSMRVQREIYERLIHIEAHELAVDPEGELEELVRLFQRRGIAREAAQSAATAMMADPGRALEVHAREEPGWIPMSSGRPCRGRRPWRPSPSARFFPCCPSCSPAAPGRLELGRPPLVALFLVGLAHHVHRPPLVFFAEADDAYRRRGAAPSPSSSAGPRRGRRLTRRGGAGDLRRAAQSAAAASATTTTRAART